MVKVFTESSSVHKHVTDREIGKRPRVGSQNRLRRNLSESIRRINTWDPAEKVDNPNHGGIFNFDFSTDGSLLVAACENRRFLVFDPYNAKLLASKANAHSDCVNCVRFLDNRTFVTCSDDNTVCLWDSRYLKHKVCTLRGHSNWVKNIEYASESGVLLTSGFDGSIFKWEINRYTDESQVKHERLYHCSGLMRTRLSPDGTKLLLASSDGYLIVIHNLDLDTFHKDMAGFNPTHFRIKANKFKHMFTRWKNRVEIISDFPSGDDAEIVASLEVHPHGWCMASRNTVKDEMSEWTCIHDIHTNLSLEEDSPGSDEDTPPSSPSPSQPGTNSSPEDNSDMFASHSASNLFSSIRLGDYRQVLASSARASSPTIFLSIRIPPTTTRGQSSQGAREGTEGRSVTYDLRTRPPGGDRTLGELEEGDEEEGEEEEEEEEEEEGEESEDSEPEEASSSQTISVEASPSTSHQAEGESPAEPVSGRSQTFNIADSVTFILRSGTAAADSAERVLASLGGHKTMASAVAQQGKSIPRLTHYIQESNQGKGFIKEICFSRDGRLLCSPFGFGIRLLAFSPDCSELCDCVPESPRQLHEVTSVMTHRNVVLTAKFSPTQMTLVTGCREGKIDFHQPIF